MSPNPMSTLSRCGWQELISPSCHLRDRGIGASTIAAQITIWGIQPLGFPQCGLTAARAFTHTTTAKTPPKLLILDLCVISQLWMHSTYTTWHQPENRKHSVWPK